jgi:hypothetical protein
VGSGNFYDGVDFRYLPSGGSSAPPVQVARDGRLGSRLINTDFNNFAPRLGIAWSPSDKWSVRTGFGIFYSQESKNSIFDLNRGLGGRTSVLPDTTKVPTTNYTNFINASALPVNIVTGLTWGANPNLPITYSMQYVLNVQRAIGKSTTLEAGYNGSQSRKVNNLTNQNAPLPGITAFATRAPYPEHDTIQLHLVQVTGRRERDPWCGERFRTAGYALPVVRVRPGQLQRSPSVRDLDSLQPAFWKGTEISQPWWDRQPGGGRLAGEHDYDAAERAADRHDFLGFGGNLFQPEQQPAELRGSKSGSGQPHGQRIPQPGRF